MSFGARGVKGLYVRGGNKVSPKPGVKLKVNQPVTLDFDVFIGSDADYPYLIPNFTTASSHRAKIGLMKADGSPLASVFAGAGTWQYWNGNAWTDSGITIHYDCWNHIQLALDGNGNYKVTLQVEGQVPVPAGQGRVAATTGADTGKVTIDTSGGHFSCYDNLLVTSGKPVGGGW